ncbi:MAG: hypothetical protein ACUZ8H_07470, partial [Candidatus Anammoxibacter sp.]
CIVSMCVIYTPVANGNDSKTEKVIIRVVNDAGNSIGSLRFTVKMENQTQGHIEIEIDTKGRFEIGAENVGKKLQLTSFGLQGEWTEIKAEGRVLVVKCEHKETPMLMVNPWGHSRASSSR